MNVTKCESSYSVTHDPFMVSFLGVVLLLLVSGKARKFFRVVIEAISPRAVAVPPPTASVTMSPQQHGDPFALSRSNNNVPPPSPVDTKIFTPVSRE